MERISIGGETYVKAGSIARELGYTADYVGQLCRGKKIDAQLVGRNWFVNEHSIRSHKRDRYRSTATKSRENLQQQLDHSPVHRQPSIRFSGSRAMDPHHKATVYEHDEGELLPFTKSEKDHTEHPIKEETSKNVVEFAVEQPGRETKPIARSLKIRSVEEAPRTRVSTTQANLSTAGSYATSGHPSDKGSGSHSVLAASFATALAVVLFAAFVGLEGHVVSDPSGSYATYDFNPAQAIKALGND